MNGAKALLKTLTGSGVEVCFTNPGTSEMHFVAALDEVPEMHAVLALFEGVTTGAADGYARIAGKPASTLLHLGPGMANALANMHNAKKARTPMVNVIGDHATYHRGLDAPLTSDIETLARPMSHWVKLARSSRDTASLAREAVQQAMSNNGQIATLILPADSAWDAADEAAPLLEKPVAPIPAQSQIEAVAAAIKQAKNPALLLRGSGLEADGLELAGRIADGSGARLMCDTFAPKLAQGAGRVRVERIPYFAEQIVDHLQGVDLLVLVGTQEPVAFFAYPDKPSRPVPESCPMINLATPEEDSRAALSILADMINPDAPVAEARRAEQGAWDAPSGDLDLVKVGQSLARLLPEGALLADEAATSGLFVTAPLAQAAPHTHCALTGGAIGQGVPLATGMALAAQKAGNAPTVCLQGDGGAMYTIQALWTQMREKLHVINIIFANRAYQILNIELMRVGAENPGPKALSQFDLTNPEISFVKLAEGLGVPAYRPETAESFEDILRHCLATPGPHLIEVMC